MRDDRTPPGVVLWGYPALRLAAKGSPENVTKTEGKVVLEYGQKPKERWSGKWTNDKDVVLDAWTNGIFGVDKMGGEAG